MADITLVNTGSAPDAGDGDPLRTAFDTLNDDLLLLKNLQGPCVGTKYFDWRLAIKSFTVNYQYLAYRFYVSKIVTGITESGQKRYTIEVSKSNTYTSAGSVVMQYTTLESALKYTTENIYMAEYGSSGLWGLIVVNWALLTASTTYTSAIPAEGFLFAVNTVRESSSPGGGGGISPGVPVDSGMSVEVIDSSGSVDGAKDLYLVSVGEINITIANGEDQFGKIKIKNISDSRITLIAPSVTPVGAGPTYSAKFDGLYDTITIDPLQLISFDLIKTSSTPTYITLCNGAYTAPA